MGDNLTTSSFVADAGAETVAQAAGSEISHANDSNFTWSFEWSTDELTSSGAFQWCTLRVNGNDLTSADGPGSCSTKAFSVIANQPPTAAAGPDQSVNEGVTVSLDGTNSTDEFPTLSYLWEQTAGPTVVFSDATSATPTFTAPSVDIGGDSVTLTLTVTEVNHDGLNDTDTVVVNIANINQPPVADAGVDQDVAESSTVTLDGTGTNDPDAGDTLTYAWLQTSGPTVSLSSASAVSPTFQSPAVSIGGATLVFELTVTDLELESSTDAVTINVLNDNEPPVAVAGADQTVDEGTLVQLDGSSSTDETPGSLQYAWSQTSGPTVSISNANTATPSFTAPDVGFDGATAATIQLTVTDAFGLATSDSLSVTINNVNLAPTASAGPDQTVGEDVLVTLTGAGSTDPDLAVDDVLTYAWSQTAGISVTLSSTSAVSPTFQSPFVGAAGGSATFSLTVTDRGSLQSSDTVIVTFTDGNVPPVSNAGADQTVNEGSPVALDGSGSTDDVPATLQYAWTQVSGPAVSLTGANTSSASFTAPEVGFDGIKVVTLQLQVTDEESLTSTDSVAINLTNINQPPVANAGADQTVGENVLVTLSGATSTDPDLVVDDSLSYAWTQTSGPAVSLSSAASVSPTFQSPSVGAAGDSASFQLTVTDRGALQDSASVTINFVDGNTAPIASAGADQSADEGAPVALDGSGSSDDVPATLQYAWSQTAGPAIALSGATTATPSFTAPEVGFDGLKTVTLTLTVTDEETLTSSDTVSITINNLNQAPSADAGTDQTVGENVLVTLNGSASSDPDTAVDDQLSYAWAQSSGSALSLSNANTASPTFQSPSVGASGETAVFSLTVTDRGGLTSNDSVSINFTDGNVSPVADAGPDQTVNEGVVVTLDGSGSTDEFPSTMEFNWSQTSGPSVTLTAATTATPSFTAPEVGFDGDTTVTLTLTVTDEESLTSSDTVTVNITNLNQPPLAEAGADQSAEQETLVTLDGTKSSDPDTVVDDFLSYQWEQLSGTAVTLSGETTATPSFVGPLIANPSESLTFQLTVTDRAGATDTDSVVVTLIDSGNEPPNAVAGADVEVVEQMVVSLDGSGSSDVDGSITQFLWTQVAGEPVTLQQPDQAVTSFVAPEAPATGGALRFQLQVTDDDDATSTALTNVYVTDSDGALPPVAAILPSSRSVAVSGEASTFATIVNPSDFPLLGCAIAPATTVQADFDFFATDPQTNQVTGSANMPVDIAPQQARTFVLFFDPTGPFSATEIEFTFVCDNAPETVTINGVNTFQLAASTIEPADMLALVATLSGDGTARIPGPNGVQAFSAATINVGSAANITATVEATPGLNLNLSICETNPADGTCLTPASQQTTSSIASGGTSTYSVFITATGAIAFDPAVNRIQVVFRENGEVRGSTSVAVTTE